MPIYNPNDRLPVSHGAKRGALRRCLERGVSRCCDGATGGRRGEENSLEDIKAER